MTSTVPQNGHSNVLDPNSCSGTNGEHQRPEPTETVCEMARISTTACQLNKSSNEEQSVCQTSDQLPEPFETCRNPPDRLDSGYHSVDDEADCMDGLYVRQFQAKTCGDTQQQAAYNNHRSQTRSKSPKTRSSGLFSCTSMNESFHGKRVHCMEVCTLKIIHNGSGPEGDDFGASLVSELCNCLNGTYWVHRFKIPVDRNLGSSADPAPELRLRNDIDELVKINGRSLIHCNNSKVAQIFRDLPVDSVTPLHLQIRRNISDERYKWISISCILSPEDKHVQVTEPTIAPVKNSTECEQEYIRLKMGTGYLCDDNGKINLRKLKDSDDPNGKLKLVVVKKQTENRPEVQFYAALETAEKKFIGPDENENATLLDNTFLYSYGEDGNCAFFSHPDNDGHPLYLSGKSGKARFTRSKYKCEKFNVNDEADNSQE